MAIVAVVISSIALATIVIISIVGYNKASTIQADYNSKMRDVVDQINTAQYYEYEFDKKNKENINELAKNLDTVKNTYVTKEDLSKQVNTSSAEISGVAKINQLKAHSNTYNEKIPEGWGGGIHSWDIYANATIGAGTKGSVNAYMNSAGDIGAKRNMNVGGDIVANGGNNWIIHTPDDGRRSMHMAPSKTTKQQDWDWKNQTIFNADGKIKTNKLQLGDKFQLSGVGEAHGNDGWLRIFNKDGKDYYGGLAAGKLWSKNGATLGGTTTTNKINSAQGISVTNKDPGPLIEKNYGKAAHRYGVGQFPNGATRVYTSTAVPGTVNLSLAKDNNVFDDIVSVKPNRDVNITGPVKFPNNGTGLVWGANHSKIYDDKNLHIDTDDNMYLKAPNRLSVQQANNNTINFTPGWQATPDGSKNVSEISNDTGRFKTLMIVGNKSAGAERRVGIWDRLDVNGPLNASGLSSVVKNGSTNRLNESWFPYKNGDTYIRPGANGKNIQIGDMWAANVNIGKGNTNINLNGRLNTPNGHTIYSKGRQHIHGEENLYLLNKKGVIIGKEWGGNGNLSVQGDANVGKLCIEGTCITKADLDKIKNIASL